MLSKATVIGAGAMGTLAAQLLSTNGIHVALLGRRPELIQEMIVARENSRYLPGIRLGDRVRPTLDAERAFANTELIVSAVPCQHLRSVMTPLARLISPEPPICSVTKGIDVSTLQRPSEILAAVPLPNEVAVLSGPSIALEVARCLPATVVVASARTETAELVRSALGTSWFRVYTNPDVIGVELAGALKNVVAIAAGILDGLHAGDNAKSALVTRGLVEITRLGVALGARAQTFGGLAGVGDLVTTCFSPLGRNRSAGAAIGSGRDVESVARESSGVVEGIPTTRAVLQLARRADVEMPITEAVHAVLFHGKPALQAITELMTRPPKAEEAY